MIVTSISGRVRPGCMQKAGPFLRQFQEVIKEVTGNEAQIAGKLGALGEVMVFATSENGSALEEGIAKLWASDAYHKIMDEGAEIFDGEATQVAMWKVVE